MSSSRPGSSQGTNEDPTGPHSSAAHATITITPHNAEAKLAFSEVADWIYDKPQARSDETDEQRRFHSSKFMWIHPTQKRDVEVGRLLHRIETQELSSSPTSSRSESSRIRDAGKMAGEKYIWTGCFFIDLSRAPLNEARGWTVGRRNLMSQNDFVITLQNSPLQNIRQRHAVFQVHRSGRIFVKRVSDRGYVEVDGDTLTTKDPYLLNTYSTYVRFGQLKYLVEYTRFSNSSEHSKDLLAYSRSVHGQASIADVISTPTPASGTNIRIGQWTLTNAGTIGAGAAGRVSAAMNTAGTVVALKRFQVTQGSLAFRRRRRTLETITELLKASQEDRIVRLYDVITDDPRGENRSADVWFALLPFVPKTLAEWKRPMEPLLVKSVVASLLSALSFLHSHSWIHGDIKPTNIGVREWSSEKASVVLLDVEDCVHAPTGRLPPSPGGGGTVGWLSPERELVEITSAADVWAVGVTALWLLLGRHPWRFGANPWREGPEFEKHRIYFHQDYDEIVMGLSRRNLGVLGKAIACMVRHPYARIDEQRKPRPNCQETLAMLAESNPSLPTDDGPPQKRLQTNFS